MVLISLQVCLKVLFGSLNFSSKIFIEGICVVALAPVVMRINGSMFHLLLAMLSISGWYFSIFMIIGALLSCERRAMRTVLESVSREIKKY